MSYEILLDKIEKNIAKHLIFYFICVIILYDDSYAEDVTVVVTVVVLGNSVVLPVV